MPQDIFKVNLGEVVAWKLDETLVHFEGSNDDLLATNCTLNYGRNIVPTFPINKRTRVLMTSIPSGTLTIGCIVGPVGDLNAFLQKFGDVCQVNSNTMSIRPGGIAPCEGTAGANAKLKFTLSGCLINSLNLNVENRDGMGVVTSTIAMAFIGLQANNT